QDRRRCVQQPPLPLGQHGQTQLRRHAPVRVMRQLFVAASRRVQAVGCRVLLGPVPAFEFGGCHPAVMRFR
ncbi:hypothetical protein RZS08_36420, partial [Arthrospira platensis SPKY1]|nr:hypothetical protein [Arthrospira platensis SPKY1]